VFYYSGRWRRHGGQEGLVLGSYQLVLRCCDGTKQEALHRFPLRRAVLSLQCDEIRTGAGELIKTNDLFDGPLVSSAGGQSVLSVCMGTRVTSAGV
jgi:hypothetical protein